MSKIEVNIKKYSDLEEVDNINTWITLPASNREIEKAVKKICPNKFEDYIIAKVKSSLELVVTDVTQSLSDLNSKVIKLNDYADEGELSALAYVTKIYDIDALLGLKLAGKYNFYQNQTLNDIQESINLLWQNNCEAEIELIFDMPVSEICKSLETFSFADLLKKAGYIETPTGVIKF